MASKQNGKCQLQIACEEEGIDPEGSAVGHTIVHGVQDCRAVAASSLPHAGSAPNTVCIVSKMLMLHFYSIPLLNVE